MRANHLPEEKELMQDLKVLPERKGQGQHALTLAIRAVELALDEDIRLRPAETTMLLGEGAFKLPHHPIRNLKVDGQAKGSWEPDLTYGILYARLQPSEHRITYEIGYPPGEIPAVAKALATSLGRYFLSGNEEDQAEAIELIKTGRRIRQKAREERDAIKVDREGEG